MAEGKLGDRKYSVQKTPSEIEVYEGVSLSEQDIAKAFGHEKWLKQLAAKRERRTIFGMVGASVLVLAMIAACIAAGAWFMGNSVDKRTVTLNNESPSITYPVTLNTAGRPASIEMKMLNGLPLNTYSGVDIMLTSPQGEEVDIAYEEFWHESGYDDGYWQESDYSGTANFLVADAGEYQVQLTKSEASTPPAQVEVQIFESKMTAEWLIIYAVVAGIVGFLFVMAASNQSGYQSS